MSLGDQLRARHCRHDTDSAAAPGDDDESEWASRHDDTADVLDAAAVALASNGEREWDATAGALQQSPATRDLAHGMLASDAAAQESKEDAMELAVLGDTCPICLQGLVDSAMVQPCYHVFCFECISTWVESLALHGVDPPTCPLCKAPFEAVFTDVASEYDYEVFRFGGKHRDARASARQRSQHAQQQLRRRSLVYRRRMRLAKVNGVTTACVAYPSIVKVRGEYDAWLQRELEACIGADIDVTVLVTLIRCCLDKIAPAPSDAARGYRDLEAALQPFLYDDTALFVRELAHFLGSRLNVDAYDAALEYCCASAHACETALCAGSHSHDHDDDNGDDGVRRL